jgi:CRISPR-associated endonuclease/helicase Cas3
MTDLKNIGVLNEATPSSVFPELFPMGRKPFQWQSGLFRQLINGNSPESLSLPTATGKTYGILRCWLGALCEKPSIVPRRLAYVVNRRAVIDQVYEDALSLAEKVRESSLAEKISKAIPGASVDKSLGVYAFRGQRSLDHEWLSYPERPAILIGTVDMLGSRLLFRAYAGSGDWRRAQSAGLLGQDTWFVLDEPHLAHPFRNLLSGIKQQLSESPTPRPFWFTQIGATNRGKSSGDDKLQESLKEDENLASRLSANKRVFVSGKAINSDEFVDEVVRISSSALASGKPVSIAVIVSTVRLARSLTERLSSAKLTQNPKVVCITGAMRGVDRDSLLASQDFRDAFAASGRTRMNSAVLVGTHCLEAGFDGDFDLLVSDITSMPSVLQRLGRLNRVGEAKESEGHLFLIHDKKGEPMHVAATPTHEWLRQLEGHSQPAVLSGSYGTVCGKSILAAWDNLSSGEKDRLSEPTVAHPPFQRMDAMLFSMSSSLPLASKGRPELYLHGFELPEKAETSFVWRDEAQWLQGDDLAEALLYRRPLPSELGQLSPFAAREELAAMQRRLNKQGRSDLLERISLLDPWSGEIEAAFRRRDGKFQLRDVGEFANRIVVIPPDAGGYKDGFVDGSSPGRVEDVALSARESSHALSAWCWNGSKLCEAAQATACVAPPDDVSVAGFIPSGFRPSPSAVPLFARTGWLVLGPVRQKRPSAGVEQTLKQHLLQVRAVASRIASAVGLSSDLAAAVSEAAEHHDIGKAHHGFQRFLGNNDLANPIAKSAKPAGGRSPFRHEALSVLHASELDILPRQLIGAHHGNGRPVFDPTVRVPHAQSDDLTAADGAWLQNFARITAQHNPWTLAWLESLLRAADAQASADPIVVEEEAP